MKILTWNVCFNDCGSKKILNPRIVDFNRSHVIIDTVLNHNPDIAVFTEFGLKSFSEITDGQKVLDELKANLMLYEWCKSGGKWNTCDVYIGVKKDVFDEPRLITARSPKEKWNRWVEIEINNKNGNCKDKLLRILGVYVPTISKYCNINCKKYFWNCIIENFAKQEQVQQENAIIIGDFNECLGEDDSTGEPTDLSNYLMDLKALKWVDAWRITHPNEKEYTHEYSSGKYRRLDYAFVSTSLCKRLSKTYHDHNAREKRYSDHSILIVEIQEN